MTDECSNDCVDKLLFPKKLSNRPGLSHIDYRIGDYSNILEVLHRKLNQSTVLTDWTHREADDPGIALLEGASILGDILTFYQEVYANEAYLRTAQWRESIADLVRLPGYRLSPGLGGKATFAFEVKGDKPVVIPAGFPVKAQLEEQAKSVDFQTIKEATAFSYLSELNLYRPRLSAQEIEKDMNCLEVESVTFQNEDISAYDVDSIQGVNLKAGDRLILTPSGDILIVKCVKQILDRTIIEIEGSLTSNHGASVTAYRIGRSFRHFGHNAPAKYSYLDKSVVVRSSLNETDTIFRRQYGDTHKIYSKLLTTEMPLESSVDDLAAGNFLVCQGAMYLWGTGLSLNGEEFQEEVLEPFTSINEVIGVRADSLSWANLTGATTVVKLDAPLTRQPFLEGDIRRFQFHEVKGPKIKLRAPTGWDENRSNRYLNFWGTFEEARALVSRNLLLKKEGMEPLLVMIINTLNHFDELLVSGHHDKTHPWLWPISVDKNLDVFSLEDFDEENPKVTVYGNLIEATQGKTEKEAILGNGDNREAFQTFKIPKAPLTYFISKDETPPEVPELEVYVNNIKWERVSSFFSRGPKEEIYIVREDEKDNSWVQFGDGKTGARLPAGIKNIVARYRTGTGAYGPIKKDASVQAGKQINGVKKIHLPGAASSGATPETGENAREAAPGKVQSLGRLVSLKDYETEILGIAGVVKAAARWQLKNNIPSIILTVLMESGLKDEESELRDTMQKYARNRGPQRYPISIQFAKRRLVLLNITCGIDPRYREDDLRKQIKETLGLSGEEGNGIDGSDGLFSMKHRQFGQPEYATSIEGKLQIIKGVVWVNVTTLGHTTGWVNETCATGISGNRSLSCDTDELLYLHTDHFELVTTENDVTEVPADD